MRIVEIYETSDLYFAAYLHARGIPLIEMTRTGHRASWEFDFEDSSAWKAEKAGWYAGESVSGLAYSNSLRVLKAMVHDN